MPLRLNHTPGVTKGTRHVPALGSGHQLVNSCDSCDCCHYRYDGRYQLVNSFEALLLPAFPAITRTPVSAIVRTGNNFAGSATWIWWARKCGLQ